ncbi:hypothetical protein [Nitrosospira briensis]|uniref:hypothetical protein n=1 Tax=Nitrosospira briensis TaxID=35799 RepID=UPI0009447B0A|nr:hypothetical protein [Nitrosospira briensis]
MHLSADTNSKGVMMMKTLCTGCAALIAFAMLAPQSVMAYEENLLRPPHLQPQPGKSPANQGGQENIPPKPWESRPWDSASEEVRPKELRPGEQKAMDDRRRAGRKARKERLEKERGKEKETTEEVSSVPDRTRQHHSKWRRHQMESERYYPAGMR